MKLAVDYIENSNGKPKEVRLSFTTYQRLMAKLEKYEKLLKIKTDLTRAFEEVKLIQQGKIKKQTLSEFLRDL